MSDATSSMEKTERVYPEIENLINESDETLRSYLDAVYLDKLPNHFWESVGLSIDYYKNRPYTVGYVKKRVRMILYDRSEELAELYKELVILNRKIETKKMNILCGN